MCIYIVLLIILLGKYTDYEVPSIVTDFVFILINITILEIIYMLNIKRTIKFNICAILIAVTLAYSLVLIIEHFTK